MVDNEGTIVCRKISQAPEIFMTARLNHSWIHQVSDRSDKTLFSLIKLIRVRLLVLKIKST